MGENISIANHNSKNYLIDFRAVFCKFFELFELIEKNHVR